MKAQEPDSTQQVDKFADTTGGYGFMYLSTTCIECNPKGSAHYKKFAIISGFYKARDFYSSVATRSVGHFKNKFEKLGYFKDKVTQTWKSPKLFATLQEIIEYRDDLIAKLKSENYVVVFFDDRINTEELERE
ncbi:MAG: hypothetical protein HYI21_01115 [Sediminibacterium sp. Gen4]|uniref:hypothetical protein n=1 Tax=unclassified Sediminibacterium TaxID=2635961 RepID=UPI0015B901E2|nr:MULTISPECIES: hypothetical protein [unclassified Sediminibacterium]MBW0160263.1 hypothetical protein [Sediminibacterium sp.]MBW0165152.1 hypothetical protein [Sediminibacterium sp.]MDZ4071896.1 hypothetical protein [Sediminibacterium sp.]NWK64606.1 hypothetical protein [Sediminibacterium sp. Gen4]